MYKMEAIYMYALLFAIIPVLSKYTLPMKPLILVPVENQACTVGRTCIAYIEGT